MLSAAVGFRHDSGVGLMQHQLTTEPVQCVRVEMVVHRCGPVGLHGGGALASDAHTGDTLYISCDAASPNQTPKGLAVHSSSVLYDVLLALMDPEPFPAAHGG
jgi:hypothetical protein